MNTFTTKDGTSIFYKDWGTAPVTFSHGWPLSADAWDSQTPAFISVLHFRRRTVGYGELAATR
jgi:pimeloyl-ACP methyl ester carboxylesterase